MQATNIHQPKISQSFLTLTYFLQLPTLVGTKMPKTGKYRQFLQHRGLAWVDAPRAAALYIVLVFMILKKHQ
jgi:hypothetical protein